MLLTFFKNLFFRSFPRIKIDGPYGAPAQDYKKYEVVLLIGLGIGATPMISIIKDIINNMMAKEQAQLNQMEKGSQQEPQGKKETFKTRRAYFYWVTREQGSYDWFKNIMNEIAERDKNKIIELHNYCTSVYEEDDARSALIHMLQSLNHSKNGLDIVSGTRVMSHFAKPNWENVYKQIAMDHPGSNVGKFSPSLSLSISHTSNGAVSVFSFRTIVSDHAKISLLLCFRNFTRSKALGKMIKTKRLEY